MKNYHELSAVDCLTGTEVATLTFQCCSCGVVGLKQNCVCSQIGRFIGRPLQCSCGAIARTGDAEFLRKRESKF